MLLPYTSIQYWEGIPNDVDIIRYDLRFITTLGGGNVGLSGHEITTNGRQRECLCSVCVGGGGREGMN